MDEVRRLASLQALGVLDTAPEPMFDAIAEAAAACCGTPIALVSLVDEERQWFKANVGLEGTQETSRDVAFCDHAIRRTEVMVVPDATQDERFVANPLVTGAPAIRFYAGAPIELSDGARIGTLCAIGLEPGDLSPTQRRTMQSLAAAVAQGLEARRDRPLVGSTPHVVLPIHGSEHDVSYVGSARGVAEHIAQDAQQKQQAMRMSHILSGMGAGTWEWNVQTGETRFNERWAEIIGYTLEELGDTTIDTWMAHAHPDDLAASGALLEAHFRGDTEIYEREARMRHRDGHWVWVLDRGRVMTRTDDGAPEWMFGTHLDLSQRRRQQEALARSEWLLDKTGQLSQTGGWVVDLADGIPQWTTETRRIHGVPDDYVPNMEEAIAFYAPEARPIVAAVVERAMSGGPGWDLELPFIRFDGEQIWVRAVGEVERENGQPVRLIGAFQDITEARRQREELREASERLALATDSANLGVWEYDIVAGDVVWDAQMYRLYGEQPGDPRGPYSLWSTHLHPDDREESERRVAEAIEGGRRFELDFRVVWSDGSVHTIHAAADVHRDPDGKPLRMIGVNWDVTEQQRLAHALHEQHERMRVTLRSIGDAVITTDALGRVEWMNTVASQLTGWCAATAVGHPIQEVFHIVHEHTRQPVPCPVADCVLREATSDNAQHTVLLAADGAEYGIEESAAPILAEDGQLLGVVLVFRDVTEQRRIASEMTYRATHDPLTGLVNREEFELRLSRALDRAHVDGSTNAVMFIDLDRFKIVNDTCGHPVGDELLKRVAKLLGEDVRASDTLARLGGDEFAIILEHCNQEVAERIGQTICDRMDAFRFAHDEHTFRIGASIGLAPADKRFDDAAAILQAVDACCFAAKEAGRNRVHRWRPSDAAMAAQRGQTMWATRVERAIDEDAFVLHAQRITPINGDPSNSAEVLVRMVGEEGKLIYPGAFLPSAERFGLASRLDAWVLTATLDALTERNPGQHEVTTLNVNLSGQSIGDPAFHTTALELLDAAGRDVCERLCLEITETAAVTNMADARVFVAKVRERGVRIALDDFGAGASSFGYLRQLPVDVIKIDGQYVQRLLHDELDDATVRCFIDIARVVGATTVAEFVDDPDILDRIGELGVDYAQGFLVHRPEPLADVLAWEAPRELASA